MPSTLHPEKLLHYIPTNRVLICKECHYAIQPSAVSRHLKVLHQIYRSDRQQFIQYSQGLDLANPGDVLLPESHEPPIPFLPTENGLACGVSGCNHLCASAKRMKSHWAAVHRNVVVEPHVAQWRPVKLQTFFRGNQLRYFIVSGSSAPQPGGESDDSGYSSYEIGPVALPLSLTDDSWSTDDLGLLEHFTNSACFDIGHAESTNLWKTAIPALARQHTFLKHGLLAVSALHFASLHPKHKAEYQMVAACQMNRALPIFRAAIAHPNEDNCNALLAFAQLLILHTFAAEDHDENLLLVRGEHESGLPDWLQLIRGSCAVFENLMPFISGGPFKLLKDDMDVGFLATLPEAPECNLPLAHIASLPSFRSSGPHPNPPDGSQATLSAALHSLSLAFSKAHAAQSRSYYTIYIALYIWPAQVSPEYLDLLRQRDPAALVLLAHYCVLLKPLEKEWYVRGFSERLVARISRQLDPGWREWLGRMMEKFERG